MQDFTLNKKQNINPFETHLVAKTIYGKRNVIWDAFSDFKSERPE